MISIPAFVLKLTLTRHNLERNLRIIYDHRVVVLQQYEIFENAIGDETDEARRAKNEYRLSISHAMFSDPVTGYTKVASAGDLNISPVMKLAETAAKASK